MTTLSEEDIGRRALLDILVPVAHASDSATDTARRKKQRFRLKKRRLREEGTSEVDAEPRPTRISVVERLSSETVSVCWSDARMGRYAEQIWRLGRARTDSFCLLTGRQIRYGDRIFRPRTEQGYLTVDHNRMILACAVDDSCCTGA
ncbi:DUF3331 domain-containing protein [Paraburkholderia sp. CNPSo 3157]|uniref:DUF3331 domain-containing protein n=1 Tax=Paraburkholderia franconis TaxID=2654983 RepID=A0A7X1TM07_9BURK|nr:DUF3331 domain-containing protein [Paraburkholderia franconis]MPW24029.1 DUF3331 domain-containing protein [Paraburkholderia franconis]